MKHHHFSSSLALASLCGAATAASITLNATVLGARYDGLGGLSGGGATSRLLPDYAEPYRGQILDLLFKPFFGASLHTLKTEVGGDSFSGCGTEPSHSHNGSDLSYARGYEWWLLRQAVTRNPSIQTYALPWSFPGWIGSGNGGQPLDAAQASYMTSFCSGVAAITGRSGCDFMGCWNEQAWSIDYILQLRATLNGAGMNDTRIIVADGGWDVASAVLSNATFADAVYAIGVHYPSASNNSATAVATGKPLFSSEDSSTYFDAAGGACLARIQSWNYVYGNMSALIVWNLVSSYYDHLYWYGDSLMGASYPWSGHYDIMSPVWTSAHWAQFAWPGWSFLPSAHVAPPGAPSGAGQLPGGGTYVTLVDATGFSETLLSGDVDAVRAAHEAHFASGGAFARTSSRASTAGVPLQWSMIVETTTHAHSMCIRSNPGSWDVADEQNVTFTLDPSLAAPATVILWKSVLFPSTNEPAVYWFQRMADVSVDASSRSFTLTGLHPDCVYTVTSMDRGQTHGEYAAPPANTPFVAAGGTYSDALGNASYAIESMPAYFSDHAGSWAIMPARDGSASAAYEQVVVEFPIPWHSGDDSLYPLTIIGDWNMSDADVSVDAYIYSVANTSVVGDPTLSLATCDASSPCQQWDWNVTGVLPGSLRDRALYQCFDTFACETAVGTPVWMWPCVDAPSGCDNANNQVWTYDATHGWLITHVNGFCVTAQVGTNGQYAIVMTPCDASGASLQSWLYDAATGSLQLNATLPMGNACMCSSPYPAPGTTFVSVGLHLGGMTNTSGVAAAYASSWYNYGHWFTVSVDGSWSISRGSSAPNVPVDDVSARRRSPSPRNASRSMRDRTSSDSRVVLLNGTLPAKSMGLQQWHTLRFAAAGPSLHAYFDGTLLGQVGDDMFPVGWAGLSTGWHVSQFRNFSMTVGA